MSVPPTQPDEKLPGYELIEKIGSGGYGEVWSATAPGGLRKAVKYVFGDQYDKRAAHELHALEKVRSVRHPFLLSLERIEIIDGRLLVVSELADGSLRDRFCECVRQGLAGIPRDELLRYLSDAADALDYLGREHDLAHLDIKPENLLLVAGHVKVADFGLVKSIGAQTQASLVGGMTPTYAAPEVFRGDPGHRSDQYSLAILYQEMLTGSVPFPGANAAQLTLQHMNDDPDLSRLSESDRFVVSRALAKDVAHRFDSSSAFVAALQSAADPAISFGAAPQQDTSWEPSPAQATQVIAPQGAPSLQATEVFGEAGPPSPESMQMSVAPLEHPEPSEAPPLEAEPATDAFQASPAVFIGLGGTGVRVLRALRKRLVDAFGDEGVGPALAMLAIDSDPQTLSAATRRGELGVGLDANETIALPLRRPQEYRSKSDQLLRWLGRRWLYNVPRSLRTEGIRPLGRLALIDHARQTFQRMRSTIAVATDEASLAESSSATGVDFASDRVRVYVVASASGGVGSGMTSDIAYAVRSILGRLGVGNSTLIGVVTHSTSREATRSELARVNAYAWLSEFQQLRSSTEGYPGDSGVGLPGHPAGVAAFDHAYFLPLGEKIDTPTFDTQAEAIADYLVADAVSPAGATLDASRSASPSDGPTLRSFAVRRQGPGESTPLSAVESSAVQRLLDRWAGDDPTEEVVSDRSTDHVVHGAVAFLGQTQLDPATLASNCRALLEASLGGDANAFADATFGELTTASAETLTERVDSVFHLDRNSDTPRAIGGKAIEDTTQSLADRLTTETTAWVFGRLNDPQERCEGARRAVAWLLDHLESVTADLVKVRFGVDADRARWLSGVRRGEATTEVATRLFQQRMDQASLAAAQRIVESLAELCGQLRQELDEQRAALLGLREGFAAPPSGDAAANARYATALDERVQADFLDTNGGLALQLATECGVAELRATLAHLVRRVVGHASVEQSAEPSVDLPYPDPPIEHAGGEYRHLRLTSAVGDSASDTLLVTEMSGVSLPHVAASAIGARRDFAAFAERVRTRRDIPWVDPVRQLTATDPTPAAAPVSAPASDSIPLATAVIS